MDGKFHSHLSDFKRASAVTIGAAVGSLWLSISGYNPMYSKTGYAQNQNNEALSANPQTESSPVPILCSMTSDNQPPHVKPNQCMIDTKFQATVGTYGFTKKISVAFVASSETDKTGTGRDVVMMLLTNNRRYMELHFCYHMAIDTKTHMGGWQLAHQEYFMYGVQPHSAPIYLKTGYSSFEGEHSNHNMTISAEINNGNIGVVLRDLDTRKQKSESFPSPSATTFISSPPSIFSTGAGVIEMTNDSHIFKSPMAISVSGITENVFASLQSFKFIGNTRMLMPSSLPIQFPMQMQREKKAFVVFTTPDEKKIAIGYEMIIGLTDDYQKMMEHEGFKFYTPHFPSIRQPSPSPQAPDHLTSGLHQASLLLRTSHSDGTE